ncbi:MAG: 3-deoxy-D-manno-octulosonic acid kinase [Gammaproteobacteria bacterium]|nr:3-deoxy-D-manno-octulosonic acid kinase [Gammaproteobacteria bacterium]
MNIDAQEIKQGDSFILFDAAMIAAPAADFFELEYWRNSNAMVSSAQGRAAACIFRYQDHEYVLRRYRRGGWMAKLSADRYLWTGLEQTRAWCEWHLLAEMYQQGLPVPRPVATRVRRHGLCYSADLITLRLPNVETLADRLAQTALPESQWKIVGRTIRRFHDAGIFHADLNARNILLAEAGQVFLIDFDKGERRVPDSSWQRENLQRLQRSLNKIKAITADFNFDETAMQRLMKGYLK